MKQWVRRMRGGAPRVAFCCQGFSSPRLFGGENPWEELVGLGPLFALAGAVCAAGSLAVARRAERRALLDARTEPGLPTSEKQKPLGDVD
jgi:hypothetical protein